MYITVSESALRPHRDKTTISVWWPRRSVRTAEVLPADLAALCTCLAWVLRWLDVAFMSPQRVTPAIVWSREQLERAPRSIPVLARSVCVRMLTTLYS